MSPFGGVRLFSISANIIPRLSHSRLYLAPLRLLSHQQPELLEICTIRLVDATLQSHCQLCITHSQIHKVRWTFAKPRPEFTTRLSKTVHTRRRCQYDWRARHTIYRHRAGGIIECNYASVRAADCAPTAVRAAHPTLHLLRGMSVVRSIPLAISVWCN